MNNLLSSQFKLGGDASARCGPVGRHASADTDWKMRAEVLTLLALLPRLFAGLELTAPSSSRTRTSTRDFYGVWCPSRPRQEKSTLPKMRTRS